MTEKKLQRKKLIEVALPLEAINKASAHEKQPGIGAHPRGLHLWWARRPLAAARAVIFAQMVDDPGNDDERQKLFVLIEEMVKWENPTKEEILERAREEIRKSWRATCAENRDHPRAAQLFNPDKLPAFHDPFAGGGALPLEAQRLGLESYASDLNPVAVLINKAMIEIPPKFANRPPVNPEAHKDKTLFDKQWRGAQGLAEDVRYYGQRMRDEAERRIGHLYPRIEITKEMAKDRDDLKPYAGQRLTVIAWLWARTVKSPNPAFAHVDVPLVSTFMLSAKPGKEAYVEPVIEGDSYRFTVKMGKPKDAEGAKNGTKLARANFRCVMSGSPISGDYIKAEGQAGRMGARLIAIVAEGERGRIYLAPTREMETVARQAEPMWRPAGDVPARLTGGTCVPYGLKEWGDLFTPRQLVALTTFSDLVQEAREQMKGDALTAGLPNDGRSIDEGGSGATAYAEAVAVYLAFAISRLADYNSSIATWKPSGEQVMQTYKRQAIPMTWDFPESNVLGTSAICWKNAIKYTADNLIVAGESWTAEQGYAFQTDASQQSASSEKIISTDPPYYDNISYADLSDFFYVWLRRSLKAILPSLFATLSVPKAEELVATPYRHGGTEQAEAFFLNGMTQAMHRLAEQTHPAFPVTIYYAFKQSETETAGTTSTGWETFLDAVIEAGLAISGTWPMRTELSNRIISRDTNALASSIVLVCRQRAADAPTATRREFLNQLKTELPVALSHLQRSNIAPVDLAQAAIGPGMAVFTRYAKVLDAAGKAMPVREALAMINQTLDEALAEQEGDFDADTRWALAWFEQYGFAEGEYGVAETLSKAKNTSVAGMVAAGILASKGGKVRMLKPDELPADWDPENDTRQNVWEMTHHLVRALESGGEPAAAQLVRKLGGKAEVARELAYRLYTVCERKKRAAEALSYNGLVQSWPEIARLAREGAPAPQRQESLFENKEG
jgi:putative DNA methylase